MILHKIISIVLWCLLSIHLSGQAHDTYTHIDSYARKAPKQIREDVSSLSKHLIAPAQNDFEKIRAIYIWISNNIRYDSKAIAEKDYSYNFNSTAILKRRKAVCTGFSTLLKDMCQEVGIDAVLVEGYSKETLTSKEHHEVPDHAWNAVLLSGQWYLADVTWARGLSREKEFDDRYFLTPPQIFIQNHLPSLPMWQLLECPIRIEDFKERVETIADSTSCAYDYGYYIQHFLGLNSAKQRLYRDTKAYEYNPTVSNERAYGHALVDYAGILMDSIDANVDSMSTLHLSEAYETIVELCAEAEARVVFYPWQIEIYASALVNLGMNQYQLSSNTENVKASRWREIKGYFEKSDLLISNLKPSYYKTQLANTSSNFITRITQQLGRY